MKTVLVVDDERLIRWSLQEGLKDRYKVLAASSVDEALEMLGKNCIDVVLTDLKMPGRHGMRLVEYVRGHLPDVKVFIMTAHGSLEDEERGWVLDVEGYIRKPFDIALIRDMIDLHLAWPRAS